MAQTNTYLEVKAVPNAGHTYDVWWGEGWNNHSRVKVHFDTKRIEYVSGLQIPFQQRNALIKYLKVGQ